MTTQRSRKKTAQPATTSKDLITPKVAQQLNAIHLMEAEVNLLSERLNNMTAFKLQLEHSGEESKVYLKQLMERRTELLQKLRAVRASTIRTQRLIDVNLQNILPKLSDLLSLWVVLPVPVMTEGISDTPGVPGTSGEIGTAGLFQGGLGFGGMPEDDGTQDPYTEKWWIHNWDCSIVFPPAPQTGSLTYRFVVDNETHIYLDPVYSGSVRAFITVGTTSDVSQPIQNWNTVGWPVNITLPSSTLNFNNGVPITGEIAVEQGQVPAVGLIFGVIVSVASGYVQFLWGNFGTRLTLSAGQTVGPTDYGKIEYYYYPRWWIEAVSRLMR
jgi:hypothetical protein